MPEVIGAKVAKIHVFGEVSVCVFERYRPKMDEGRRK
jgi:hypothetical protein